MTEKNVGGVVVKKLEEARVKGEIPDLRGSDLRYTNLKDADLRSADLWGADLQGADLRGAELQRTCLRYATLRGADLQGADLWGADLQGADLRGANLWGTNLHGTYLWGGLQITDLPSGQLILIPTCDGWHLHVGCWDGTPDQLRALIAQDEGWPEAEGEEISRRRPYLEAALALCEIHMKDHADIINDLKEWWGEQQ